MSGVIREAGRAPTWREFFAPSQETAKQQGEADCKQPMVSGENTPHDVFSAELYPTLRKTAPSNVFGFYSVCSPS